MKQDRQISLMDYRRTWAEKLASTVATFGLLGLCIWASQGSTWWTFFTGVLFLITLVARIAAMSKRSKTEFADIHALKGWVNEEVAKDAATTGAVRNTRENAGGP